MSGRILITFASRTGTTQDYAEVIGKAITGAGFQVDVLPMDAVTDLTRYDAVLAGSAIRKSKWLPEAIDFLKDHHAELNRKPFAMFTVCITRAMSADDEYQRVVKEWVEPMRALVNPLADGVFPGRLDFSKLPLTLDTIQLRMAVVLGIFPRQDRCDFAAARAWAEELAPRLKM